MQIKFIATGSKGNCYIVNDGYSSLMLDAGVPIEKMMERLGGQKLPKHCLITHEHKDHCRAVHQLVKHGIKIYSSAETLQALNVGGKALKHNQPVIISNHWRIIPLDAEHDAIQPMMYVIKSLITGKCLLYATDTASINYEILGLTHLLVEINYDLEYVLDDQNAYRLLRTHMSVQKMCEWLMNNSSAMQLQEIHLCHGSNRNLDEDRTVNLVQRICGCPVYSWHTYHRKGVI